MENSGLPTENAKASPRGRISQDLRLGCPAPRTGHESQIQVTTPNADSQPPPTSARQTESAASPRVQEPSARRSLLAFLRLRPAAATRPSDRTRSAARCSGRKPRGEP